MDLNMMERANSQSVGAQAVEEVDEEEEGELPKEQRAAGGNTSLNYAV